MTARQPHTRLRPAAPCRARCALCRCRRSLPGALRGWCKAVKPRGCGHSGGARVRHGLPGPKQHLGILVAWSWAPCLESASSGLSACRLSIGSALSEPFCSSVMPYTKRSRSVWKLPPDGFDVPLIVFGRNSEQIVPFWPSAFFSRHRRLRLPPPSSSCSGSLHRSCAILLIISCPSQYLF